MSFRLTKTQAIVTGGIVAVVVIGAGTTFALAGNDKKAPSAQPSAPASVTVKPTPTTPAAAPVKAKPKVLVNPLTGIGKPPTGPIIAVKIDDTASGRPSVGLDQSDVIYVEQAEGGLTRMVAVFGTHKPTVEAVRSVRASDAELLSQYGGITLVASGGGGDSLSTLDHSIVKSVINDRNGPGFGRDDSRTTPYNLTSNLTTVSRLVHTAGSKNVGFAFSPTDPRATNGIPAPTVHTVVGGTSVDFRWVASLGRFARVVGGEILTGSDGAPIAKPNVIVQLCSVSVNPNDVDVMGNPSQFTHSVGSGRAILFRNGKRIEGKWSRPTSASPTTYTDLKGKPLTLALGGAFVVLATNGAPVT